MQVTVLGAGGQVGQIVVRLCLERGHSVRALVHSHNPFDDQPDLTVVTGDIYSADDIDKAIDSSQAIVSALGSWHTKHKTVLSSAMKLVIPTMRNRGINRIVTVTGTAAMYSADQPRWFEKASRLVLFMIAPKILRDGEAHLELLAASDLDWTSIRSPAMNGKPIASYVLRAKLSPGLGSMPRLAVATAIVDQLERSDFSRLAPVIYKS